MYYLFICDETQFNANKTRHLCVYRLKSQVSIGFINRTITTILKNQVIFVAEQKDNNNQRVCCNIVFILRIGIFYYVFFLHGKQDICMRYKSQRDCIN